MATQQNIIKWMNQNRQNSTFIEPLLIGLKHYGYQVKTTAGEINRLIDEYRDDLYSGSKYGAIKGGSLVRQNQSKLLDRNFQTFESMQVIHNALDSDNYSRYLYGYSLLFTLASGSKVRLDDDNRPYWSDNKGRDIYGVMTAIGSKVNRLLYSHRRKNGETLAGVNYSAYGLGWNIEPVIRCEQGRAVNHVHVHSELLIDNPINIDTLRASISSSIKGLGLRVNVSIRPIMSNYKRNDERPAVIDLERPLTSQKPALKAFDSVVKYDTKTMVIPSFNHNFRDDNGNKTTNTQGDEFARLSTREQAKAVIALINSSYRRRLHLTTGLLGKRKASELMNESSLYLVNFGAKTTVQPFEYVFNINDSQRVSNESECPFKKPKTKPPP